MRLNMGITERRYANWEAALEHFQAASELATPGFCEPAYWIGITRINAGHDVGRGAQVRPGSFRVRGFGVLGV